MTLPALVIPVPHSITARLGITKPVLAVYDVEPVVLVTDVYHGDERLNLTGNELDDATVAVRQALKLATPDTTKTIDEADDRNERVRDAVRAVPRWQHVGYVYRQAKNVGAAR